MSEVWLARALEGSRLTNNWHDGGAALVIAPSRMEAERQLDEERAWSDWAGAERPEVDAGLIEWELLGHSDDMEGVYVFPDAGCC